MSEHHILVAMRLKDMVRHHPRQDDTRVCAACGETVGIYPTGQAALHRHPDATILCQIEAPRRHEPSGRSARGDHP
jgi:hypothetical protein